MPLRTPPLGRPRSPTARVLQQFAITWTFDTDYPVGQVANRDFWVVGPVKIVGIDPPSALIDGRIKNGLLVNPATLTLTGAAYTPGRRAILLTSRGPRDTSAM
jgi:hypothetical protein